MNASNPLEQLRDIHLPEAISVWPPAPGWWFLALLLLSTVIWVIWKLWKHHQQKHLLRLSIAYLNELEQEYTKHQDPLLLVKQYSSLLRRIAMARFPRHEVACLTGISWLKFLDDCTDSVLFNTQAGQLLIHGPYQRPGKSMDTLAELTKAIHSWIYAVNTTGQINLSSKQSGNRS